MSQFGTPQNSSLGPFLRGQTQLRSGRSLSTITVKTSTSREPNTLLTTEEVPETAQVSDTSEASGTELPVSGTSETTVQTEEVPESATSSDTQLHPPERVIVPATAIFPAPTMASGPTIKIQTFAGRPGDNGAYWLQRYTSQCKALFNYDDDKVKASFPFYLTGQAEAWYNSLPAAIQSDTNAVKEKFEARFDGKDGLFFSGSISQHPKESVCDYTTRFLNETNQKDMPEQWLIVLYVDGLRHEIKDIVKPQELSTIDNARRAAIRAEHATRDLQSVSAVNQSDPRIEQLTEAVDQMWRLMQGMQGQNQRPPVEPPQTHSRTKDGLMFKTALLFLCLLVVLPSTNASNDMLPRLNYGIVFKQEAQITLSREFWLHTYEIKLPKHLTFDLFGPCNKSKESCARVKNGLMQLNSVNIMSQFNAIHLETESRLNNTIDLINRLVPHTNTATKSRSRRALLPFIGKFSKTLFGTATIEDVEILAGHINALNARSQSLADALVQHGQHLSSFMAQSNKRINNLFQGVKENNLAIKQLNDRMQNTAVSLRKAYEDLTSLLLEQLMTSNTINHSLDELKTAIIDLANGKLSPLLLPIDILQSTLNNIQHLLSVQYPGFFVSIKSASQMYHNTKFIYMRKESTLYLTVKIPISNSQSSLKLYKIYSMPVPINETSKHATQILDLPEYFAITHDQQFYVQMSKYQLDTCSGNKHKNCHINLQLVPVTQEICSLGLFANNKNIIKSHCNIRYVPNAISSKIIELSASKVLLYDAPILSIECKGKHKMTHGCNFCIIEVPCECSVSNDKFYLPPRLISCKNHSTHDIVKLHPVNLILLQQFFDDHKFQHIFANSVFKDPLNVTIPQFKVYDHAMSNILAQDESTHLNLTKMIEIAKNDNIVFKTLAEPILAGHINIASVWPDLNGYISLSALCFSAITTSLFLYMFWKLHKVSATLLLLQNQKANAQTTIPSFIYTNRPTPAQTSFNIDIELSWDHAMFVLLLINTLILLNVCFNYMKRNQAPKLLLEITSLKQCIFIPIMKLPLCPSLANFEIPETVTEIKLTDSLLFPKVEINWKSFTVDDQLSETKHQVPSRVSISILQAIKLRKILRKPFFINLHCCHNNFLSPVSIAQV